ncbi:hypothetical protein L5515_015089 [Caenorhabditis briggsae]|uniref:BTB domain-containing protein n=1 Tax=Caenorhabditis briggsae TaxID=6238 RepID=A0AAE9EHT9_CAEBR|nr:hypothetical protein L5515_015089 [Caenorhabditis briggsae]
MITLSRSFLKWLVVSKCHQSLESLNIIFSTIQKSDVRKCYESSAKMSNNEKDEIVRQEILEELNSHKRKFDNIAEKLQSIEESISKIPKIDDDEKKLIEDSNVLNNRNNKKLESGKRFVLKHVFKNVVNLGNDVSYSAGGVEHFNINWYMAIERNESFLEFYFYFKTIAPVGDDWSIDTKFDESQKDVSDVILVVKDTKFYVLKMYLAAQSSLFKALFLGNFSESKMTEIPLTGIEPEDFQHFLEVLYGEPSIDDTTVEELSAKMSNNEKYEPVKNEMLEELNSYKRKFDEIAEKLQSMEESISKIPKFDDNERKSIMTSSEKSFLSNNQSKEKEGSRKGVVLKYVFKNMANFEVGDFATTQSEEHFNVNWHMKVKRNESHLEFFIDCQPIALLGMTGFEKKRIRKFDESQKDVSDMILVVKDTKFYVSKMYLAAQSSFFNTLFLGNFCESKMSEIPLTGVEPEDFQHFLEILYGESAIGDSTVEGILLVADMYITSLVVRKCETFLINVSKKEFKKLLQISTKYRLEKLKTKCLSLIDTLDDVQELLPGDLSDLHPSVVLIILQKCVSSH